MNQGRSGPRRHPFDGVAGAGCATSGVIIDLAEVRPLRVAVVGCGYWGVKHLRVLGDLAGVDVIAVDPDPVRLGRLRRPDDRQMAFSTLDDALDAGLDAVVLATPAKTHAPLALQALRAGCHVMVEKPLATSTEDVDVLISAADAQNLVLMVGHTFEYNAAVQYLHRAIRTGVLGDVFYLDTARLNLGLYRQDANVLWDLAVHDISIANYLLGSVPAAVSAWAHRHAHPHFEDVAFLRMQYEDPNVTAHVHVSWLDPAKVRRVTVVGSRRMAVYDDLQSDERVRIHDKGVTVASPSEDLSLPPFTYRFGDIVSPHIDFPEPLHVEDSHFITCIRDGAEPATDGRNGGAVIAVLEAAERSLVSGASETVDPAWRFTQSARYSEAVAQ